MYRRDHYWGPKRRPTHFLAVRLTDQRLLGRIQELREQILKLEPDYSDCLIPLERLHLTICNIGLAENVNTEQLVYCNAEGPVDAANRAVSSLDEELICKYVSTEAASLLNSLEESLKNPVNDLTIRLEGAGHFSNSTLYAKVKDDDGALLKWIIQLKEIISKSKFDVLEVFDFNPHVTLLKITRPLAAKLRTRYIDGRVLSAMDDIGFVGEQKLQAVHLCEKSSNFDVDGFYKTLGVLNLQ